nr:DUF5057 domain-containing protein [uncultured Agathobacter sp.]
MSKFRKKIVVPITLILVVCLVVGTLVIYDSITSVEANASFNGISNIVSSHGKDSPFNIVEVVPSKQENNNMASIGYLIGGQEPVNLRQMLSTIIGANGSGTGSGASFRSFCMHRLFYEDYKDFVTNDANDKSKPLFWSPYNESYTKGVDDCNIPLDLAKTEPLEAGENGTTGYEMVRKDGGSYKLDTEYVPAVKDGNPCGNYNQNVDYYVYMPASLVSKDGQETKPVRGYYGVVFKEVDEHINITNYDYFNAKTTDGLNLDVTKKAYKVKSAYAIADQHTMNSIAESDPHAAIYRIDNSDISLPYEYAGLAESYKKAEGDEAQAADKADSTEASNTADFDTYTYYTLQMEYVPSDEVVNEGVTYYEVDDEKTLFFEDQSGEYGAVLDEKEPYINLNPDNSQSETREMGYFNIKEGSQVYNFAGEGYGEYEIQKKENGVLDYPVNVRRIYTKGGFTNNELFRNGVFNQDASGKSDGMSFNVQTVTPAEMDNINWSNVDLLYISGGDGSGSASYGNGNDIKGKTIFDVAKRVHESGFMMPVIVDYSLAKAIADQPDDFGSCTNIQRLAALLCCSNYDKLGIDTIDSNQYENSWWEKWKKDDVKINFDTKVDSNHPNGYVNGNIYVIPGNTYKQPTDDDKGHGAAFLLQDFNTSFLDCTSKDKTETDFVNQAKNQGFGEIAEYINSENKIRDTENKAGNKYELFDKKISKAIVISYIVSYADKRQEVPQKTSLNVLDIEPGAVSDDSKKKITNMIESWCGNANVTITHVTSSEFIGRIEDLNNYDMIYMGLVCDNNYKDKDKDGNTVYVYNDSDMNGLIYTNVGDVAVVDPSDYKNGHAGLLENDYTHNGTERIALDKTLTPLSDGNEKYTQAINTYRYSGNDLTEKKKEQLENYVKAGYPLVLGTGIIRFPQQADDKRKVNDKYIDNCSVIYEFFKDVMNKENVFNVDSQNRVSDEFVKYLAVEKPRITLKEMSKVTLNDKLKNDTEFDEVKDNKLIFEFTVKNDGGVDPNAQFELSLLLDINSDGKFSETQEKIAANDMKLYRDGQLVELTRVDDQNYKYYIQAGIMNYKLEYELPNVYVGVIPWKLKVSQATNEFRYDSKSGYFYRKNTVEKEKIKILQIDTERTKVVDNKTVSTSTFNMADNKTFKELLSKVDDFDVSITHVYANEYADKYKESKDYLNNYDMIVLGFGDMYSITNTNGCVDGIRNYIKSGRPVLFTHDTTSFSNASVGKNIWGYDFNKIIRDVVGMDRYGILSNEGLQSGATLTQNDSTSVLVNGNNKTIGTLFTEAKVYAEENHTDIAYKPKSNKSVIVRQNQGFTYLNLSRYQFADTKYNSHYCYKGLQSYSYETTSAVQVNQGQITSYPFKIPETLTVAATHRQYYQLDLNQDSDNDGESDIVVWYTLSDDEKYNNLGYHPYDSSPKDVRNNYYIYTMGNVTYSGVGHSTVGSSEDEMKLYINTLIAAYSAGTHAPSVSVKEAPDEGAGDLNNIYVTIDEAIEQENIANNADNNSAIVHDPNETNPTETVYFSIKDTNMVRGHEYTNEYVDFCVPVEKSDYDAAQNNNANNDKNNYLTVNDGQNTIYLKKVVVNVSAADDNSAFNSAKTTALQSGIMYKAQIPLNLLPQGKNSQTIYVVGHSEIKTTANVNLQVTSTAYKTFTIQRVGLADLD